MSTAVIRILIALAFVAAGVLHLVHHALFEAIVPPHMGDPAFDVEVSGFAEILGGFGLLLPGVRTLASVGLFALLVAVWPANWYMAIEAHRFHSIAPAWVLWARVPLQLLFMLVVIRVGRN